MLTNTEITKELEALGIVSPFQTFKATYRAYAVSIQGILKDKLPSDSWFAERGWCITQRGTGRDRCSPAYADLTLEPCDEQYIPEELVGNILFHATDLDANPSIRTAGLVPQAGGSTYTQRTYSPRVHLARTAEHAAEFVKSCNAHGANKQWTLIRINIIGSLKFHDDPFFQGKGVWTSSIIPAEWFDGTYPFDAETGGWIGL